MLMWFASPLPTGPAEATGRPPVPFHPPARQKGLHVTVTAYSSTVDQTDADPFTTASGQRVHTGIVALSQDLLRTYPFGSRVELCSTYEVQDTMHSRIRRTADIWMTSRSSAIAFGRRHMILRQVK